jgi:glycogen debranching enzyme glgX
MVWLRRDHPVLRRRRFFSGAASHGGESELGEIEWLRPSGERMTDQDWGTWYARAMTVFLNGEAIAEPDEQGHRVTDDSFLVLINASEEDIAFTLPGLGDSEHWTVALDTAPAVDSEPHDSLDAGEQVTVEARSMLFLTSAPETGTA